MTPLYQSIVDNVPAPAVDRDGPFQMQISALDYNSFLGVIGVGRIARGRVKPNTPVVAISADGKKRNGRILKLMGHHGLHRVDVEEAAPATSCASAVWTSCSSPTPCASRTPSKR
jgi:GTP-binding protein